LSAPHHDAIIAACLLPYLQGLTAIHLDNDANVPPQPMTRPKKRLAIRPQVLAEIPPVDARGVYLIGQRVLWLAVLSPLQWFPTN